MYLQIKNTQPKLHIPIYPWIVASWTQYTKMGGSNMNLTEMCPYHIKELDGHL